MTANEQQTTTEEANLTHLRQHRSRAALAGFPGMIMFVRSLVAPSGRQAGDGVRRSAAAGPGAPLRVDAVDDADDVYVRLVEWVSYWSAELDTLPPALHVVAVRNFQDSTHHARHTDAPLLGFKPVTTPEGAHALVKTVTVWLLLRGDRINMHPSAGTYQDDIITMSRALMGRYPTRESRHRLVSPRPCPLCGTPAVRATWASENTTDVTVACEHCGHTIDPTTHLEILEQMRCPS